MRLFALIFPITLSTLLAFACSEKKDSSGGGSGTENLPPPKETSTPASNTVTAPETTTTTTAATTATAGALGVITGELLPAAGAPTSSVVGAAVAVEGHPELSVESDADGKFKMDGVLPGTITLYVASNDGDALTASTTSTIQPSSFGLQIPGVIAKNGAPTELGPQTLRKTGGLKGKVVFYSNPNDLDLTGSDVFVPGTGFIVKTDASGAFTMSGIPPGKYSLRAQHTGFAILDLKDIDVPEDATADLGELILSLSNGPEGSVAITANQTKTIGAKVDAKIVESRTITVNLNYDRDAALMKIADEPSFTNKEWIPVSTTAEWIFATDGWKTLYVMYSDLNGLESSPFSVEFVVDTELPVVDSLAIMRGWAQLSTSATKVPLDVSSSDTGTGVDKMMLSNSANFSVNSGWINYSSYYDNWNPAGDTWVKVRDHAGRESVAVTDHINLGTYTMIRAGTHEGNVVLKKSFGPYRVEDTTKFNGSLTLEAGSALDFNMSGSNKKMEILGRAVFQGTSGDPIALTFTNPSSFEGIDLSGSSAENNVFTHIDMTFPMSTTTTAAIVIDGGIVSDVDVTGDSSSYFTFVKKRGYASLEISRNTISNGVGPYVQLLAGSNATTLRHNDFYSAGGQALVRHIGDSGTVAEYNTLIVNTNAAGSATAMRFSAGSNATYKNNVISVTSTNVSSTLYMDSDAAGATTFEHNNISISNLAGSLHLQKESASATVSFIDTYFSGCTGCIGYPGTRAFFGGSQTGGITNTTPTLTGWPTSGTKASGCVGDSCTD